MSTSEKSVPETLPAAVATVAGTYGYFLLFAQFGFLRLLQERVAPDPAGVRLVMTAMGLAGILGSFTAARFFSAPAGSMPLLVGFQVCAIGIGAPFAARGLPVFVLAAVLIGGGVGAVTVMVAAMLDRALGGRRTGLAIGLGTGLAYGFCNLPGVFDAAPALQCLLAGGFVVAGAMGAARLGRATIPSGPEEPRRDALDYTPSAVAFRTVSFAALITIDAMAFFLIQHTPALRLHTWTGAPQLTANAVAHCGAAVVAGAMFDRGRFGGVLTIGALLLLSLCFELAGANFVGGVFAVLYSAAVSIYSAALVFYAVKARSGMVAAVVYALAGWIGSGLGIGLAEERTALPIAPVVVATAALLLAAVGRKMLRVRAGN